MTTRIATPEEQEKFLAGCSPADRRELSGMTMTIEGPTPLERVREAAAELVRVTDTWGVIERGNNYSREQVYIWREAIDNAWAELRAALRA